jgi:hypothetical protein
MISIRNPVKPFPKKLAAYTIEVNPRLALTAKP